MVSSHVQRRLSAGIGLLSLALLGSAVVPAHAATASADKGRSRAATLKTGLWRPDGTVLSMAVQGKRIYIAGEFTHLLGPNGKQVARTNLAAVNRSTGKVIKSFHPQVNGAVRAVATFDGNLYLGGAFTNVEGVRRHHLAALRLSDGKLVKHWKNQVNGGPVNALVHMGKRLYVGGDFTTVSGTRRVRLYAIGTNRKPVAGWPAVAMASNGPIYTMAAGRKNKSLLVGGHFRQLVDKNRVNLASINVAGKATGWRPPVVCDKSCPVRDVVLNKKRVFAGIDGVGGRLRAYRASDGHPIWSTKASGEVDAVAVVGDEVLMGGHFARVDAQQRPMLAAVSKKNGALSSRGFSASGEFFPGVLDILVDGGVALVGGGFDAIASQSRLAAVRP